MSRSAPAFMRKSFQQHVGYIKSGRRPAPKAPPVFNAWRRVLWPLKDRFEDVQSEEELEEGVRLLFLLGTPVGDKLDIEGLRRMLHCLDPYVLDSEVEQMMDEAVASQRELMRHEKPAVPEKLFTVEDLSKIVSTLMMLAAASQRSPSSSHDPADDTFPLSMGTMEGSTGAAMTTAGARRWDNTQAAATILLGKTQDTLRSDAFGTARPKTLTMTRMLSNFMTRPKPGTGGGSAPASASEPATPRDVSSAGEEVAKPRPYHKALTLSLSNQRLPLMKCILDPHSVLEAEENKIREKERRLKEAEVAHLLYLEESLHRMKKPTRDKYGRSIMPPKADAKVADDLYDANDPRQVNRRTLITGPGKGNVQAFLRARAQQAELERRRKAAAAERQKARESLVSPAGQDENGDRNDARLGWSVNVAGDVGASEARAGGGGQGEGTGMVSRPFSVQSTVTDVSQKSVMTPEPPESAATSSGASSPVSDPPESCHGRDTPALDGPSNAVSEEANPSRSQSILGESSARSGAQSRASSVASRAFADEMGNLQEMIMQTASLPREEAKAQAIKIREKMRLLAESIDSAETSHIERMRGMALLSAEAQNMLGAESRGEGAAKGEEEQGGFADA